MENGIDVHGFFIPCPHIQIFILLEMFQKRVLKKNKEIKLVNKAANQNLPTFVSALKSTLQLGFRIKNPILNGKNHSIFLKAH